MGNNACSPTPETINNLFSVAQDGGIIPDISLDGTLANYLSLNSSTALTHQYASIQERLSAEQRTAFNLNLSSILGLNDKVSFGGVGIVALALSLLFEVLVDKTEGRGATKSNDPIWKIFGADNSSGIGSIAREYLSQLPGTVDNMEEMADLTELYDQRLKYELIKHYERMTIDQQLSSAALKQWLNGAAVHLHIRIHGIRMASVPKGSVESLRLSYRTGLPSLVRSYAAYLRRNVKETPPSSVPHAKQGMLLVEPLRKVRHWVWHSPCESKAIANAMVTRIMAAQDVQRSEDFFDEAGVNMDSLIKQQESFELQDRETQGG